VRRRVLAAFAAILLLVVGSFVLLAYVRGADERALAGVQTVEVLVVDQKIPAGTAGDQLKGMVRTELVPAKVALDGRVTDLDTLSGHVASADLQVGEQLLTSRFTTTDELQVAGTVAVPDGLQEISVLLEPQRVIGARLVAGDTVGVYLSQELQNGTKQTHGVLHHVLVTQVQGAPAPLAADAEAEAASGPPAAGAPAAALMVTLAVTARDAELVVFGMEHGTLWLSLETEGDDTSGTRVIDQDNVYVGVPR
jgi:pilus assembly protein CpaB